MIRKTTGRKKVMNLNDQYSKPAPNNLRLSKLSSIPSAEDLAFAMTLATNNPRNIVELPWKTTELPMQYTIKVTCALSLEEPRWMLHAGVGSETDAVIWNYDTPDYQLVFNLISEECEKALASAGNNGQSTFNQSTGINPGVPGNQQYQQQQPYSGGQYQQQGMQPPAQYANPMQQGGQMQDPNLQQGMMQQQNPQQQPQPYIQDAAYGAPPFQPSRSSQNAQPLPGQSTMPVMTMPGTTGNALPAMAFGAAAASILQPPPLVPPDAIAGQDMTSSRRNFEQQQLSQQLAPLTPYNQQSGGVDASQAQQNNAYPATQQGAAPLPYIEEPFGQQQYQQQHQQQEGSGQFAQTATSQPPNPFQQLGQQISQGGLSAAQAPAGTGYDAGNQGVNQFGNQQGNQPGMAHVQDQNQGSSYEQASHQNQPPPSPYISSGLPEAATPRPAEVPSSRMFTLPQPGQVRNPAERLIDKATSAEEAPAAKTPRALPPPVKFDRTAVDSVFKMLTETELGFLNHGALMFFTVREFSRFQRNNVPFSIVLFELVINNGGGWEPMPQNLVKDVGKQLFGVMRPLDLIAHYDQNDYAMLLPHTSRDESFTVVQRLHEMLNSTAVAPGLAAGQAQIFCGISTIPDDCAHPGVAIAAALEAKTEAKLTGRPVLRFCDI